MKKTGDKNKDHSCHFTVCSVCLITQDCSDLQVTLQGCKLQSVIGELSTKIQVLTGKILACSDSVGHL